MKIKHLYLKQEAGFSCKDSCKWHKDILSLSILQDVGCDDCHKSNIYLSSTLFSSIPTSI